IAGVGGWRMAGDQVVDRKLVLDQAQALLDCLRRRRHAVLPEISGGGYRQAGGAVSALVATDRSKNWPTPALRRIPQTCNDKCGLRRHHVLPPLSDQRHWHLDGAMLP